mmetsp:Transcript_66525/g.110614  ORF Transcript_66525/g.110614 Transcript_66525/m.110614 type:complete len:99 (+) Transcript_66525:234-530(+)
MNRNLVVAWPAKTVGHPHACIVFAISLCYEAKISASPQIIFLSGKGTGWDGLFLSFACLRITHCHSESKHQAQQWPPPRLFQPFAVPATALTSAVLAP